NRYQQNDDENLSVTVERYIKQNLQGRYIKTVIGNVLFNAVSKGELLLGTAKNRQRAALVPHVPNTLKNGEYLGRESNNKNKESTKKFVAFHYFKGVAVFDNRKVEHTVSVAERENGEFIFVAYHSKGNELVLDSVSSDKASRSRTNHIPYDDKIAIFDDAVNDDDWNIEIISIVDLDGNPTELEDLEESRGVESRPQVTDTNLFNYNENGIGAKTRQKRNNQAIDLAKKMINGEMSIDDITAEQKILLSQYSGSGGGLTPFLAKTTY
ncbi:hypothetical protein, partial [Chelonobacter oris]|uniref:LPD3 domain-containing protein n=1 Tax=Chelonobacter oris TaxID=505317 RepID=UPI00244818BE